MEIPLLTFLFLFFLRLLSASVIGRTRGASEVDDGAAVGVRPFDAFGGREDVNT